MNDVQTAYAEFPPHMARAFRELRSGRHVCIEDSPIYQDIRRHEEQYTSILTALGYTLVPHPQGFYFLSGGNKLNSKGLKGITLFLLILFQHLEDHKFESDERSWERDLTSKRFQIAELPHFASSASRMLMRNLEITQENLHEKILRLMSRLGFIELVSGESFIFRAPIYRFVDLCIGFSVRSTSEDRGTDPDDPVAVSKQADDEGDLAAGTNEIWEDVDDDDSDDVLDEADE